MLRAPIRFAAGNGTVERIVSNWPVPRSVVDRFVGGADSQHAVDVTAALQSQGMTVSRSWTSVRVVDKR